MKDKKFIKLFICLNLILISLIIITIADATTNIKKTEIITIKSKDKNTTKQIKKNLENKLIFNQ